ncbi:ATP-binding protein [Salisediminibacterium halotolerans]|uniref:Sensor histidine kinase n=1 Tax=Salisediminibacterium halotolerans TaxID=517425 RepID=A0A1H9VJI3_9BACI|nr:ATP-binding protein [Salisediminibacterium haloalkalitolerans]SES21497.1 PAS domain S-box-containing protein [Salisediminibacterium haloalkalitolerans]
MKSLQLEDRYLKQIFENIQDGVLIMDHERNILMMNPAARHLTGWGLAEKVPYCKFCQEREVAAGENRCYLIEQEEVPYFKSQMPTYHGVKVDVEMSTALIYEEADSGAKEYLLVLRDQRQKKHEEEIRMSKWMIQKLIEAKETEHQRLAQELHDGVGQSLYSISIALQTIESFVEDERVHQYVHEVRNELNQVMADVKSYSSQLRPKSLDRLGLVAAAEELLQTQQKTHAETIFHFCHNISSRLPNHIEINLYRVLQEALHNVNKYAEASSVRVLLEETDTGVYLNIHDNGRGFDTEERKHQGLGMKHMEERVAQLGGTFTLLSEPGEGTSVLVYVSVQEEGEEE